MRYSRQNRFLGYSDEKNIFSDKNILIIGCGGVGSVLANLLIRGGLKKIKLVDFDVVDETNLQRQIYFEKDVGKLKVKALREYLYQIDSNLDISIFAEQLTEKNIFSLTENIDLIIDCTDNIHTRNIINDYCIQKNLTWLHLGAIMGNFTCMFFNGKNSKFDYIFRKNVTDQACCDVGVLSSTTYGCASLAYNEILKYFMGEYKQSYFLKLNLWEHLIFKLKIK